MGQRNPKLNFSVFFTSTEARHGRMLYGEESRLDNSGCPETLSSGAIVMRMSRERFPTIEGSGSFGLAMPVASSQRPLRLRIATLKPSSHVGHINTTIGKSAEQFYAYISQTRSNNSI